MIVPCGFARKHGCHRPRGGLATGGQRRRAEGMSNTNQRHPPISPIAKTTFIRSLLRRVPARKALRALFTRAILEENSA